MVNISRYLVQKRNLSILLLLIPLTLSAFTHLWNPIGFPAFHVDEGHYMRRAMQVLQGLGPQESKATYDYGYDHPYLGQILLASVLSLINYPSSIHPAVNSDSIEMLYLVPRVLMGILAVVDTFLVFKIADAKYNRKVAFVAATLFAVMPLGSLLRGILLDSIALPFILLSILFAIYCVKFETYNRKDGNRKILLTLLSGIFLGLAIFTKMPVFTMIPLLTFIILKKNYAKSNDTNSNASNSNIKNGHSRLKLLAIWFVPVVLIPLIWPLYAISVGQFDNWMQGVIYETARDSGGKNLRSSILYVSEIDPILVILGAAAIIFSIIKKDYFILLWVFPYLVFLYAIGWAVPFHWNILIPLLCIALAVLVESLINVVAIRPRKITKYLPQIGISAVIIFGFFVTLTLVDTNLNTSYFQLYLFIVRDLGHHDADLNNQNNSEGTTMIGSHRTRALIWIPLYIFKDNVTFRETDIPNDNFTEPIRTKKFLLVADSGLLSRLTSTDQYYRDKRVTDLYYNTSNTIATFIDKVSNRYDFMDIDGNYGFGRFVDVRANH
jgi:Dolichyl-phosphate-mannose-protein mannosyltransferase